MKGIDLSSRDKFIARAILLFSLATIAFYLLTEHRAHLLAYSSYMIFFFYILMHLFMHRGHGRHGERGQEGHEHKGAGQKDTKQSAREREDEGQHGHGKEDKS
jgi:hypothetical protein